MKDNYKHFPLGDWNNEYQHWGKTTWFEYIFKNSKMRDVLIRFFRRRFCAIHGVALRTMRGRIYKKILNKLSRYE